MISAASTLEEVGHVICAAPGSGCAEVNRRPVIDRLIARGAVLSSARIETPILIGEARWTSSGALLLFAAFGERCEDVITIRNADVARVAENCIVWFQAGSPTFQLSEIERATLSDPEDYRIAWQLWQQIIPLKRSVIESYFDLVETRVEPAPS